MLAQLLFIRFDILPNVGSLLHRIRGSAFAAGVLLLLIPAIATPARAALILQENFANYSDGDLIGQFGWTPFGTFSTPPLQVAGGQVVLPYRPALTGSFNDGASAAKSLPTPFSPPQSGTTSIFLGTSITMDVVDPTAGDNAKGISFVDGSGFNVLRLQSRVGTVTGTFQFGARMNGGSQTPVVFGGDLPLGHHVLVMRLDMLPAEHDDVVSLYVDPPAGGGIPAAYVVANPGAFMLPLDATSITAVSINQFGTGAQNGYRLDFLNVAGGGDAASDFAAAVPEPSTLFIAAAAGVIAAVARRHRRRRTLLVGK
jgi:hypothetical protein